ncbi:MAG TPA: hypothetical protein DDZ81_25520, partial [Acetobacteraceae bacterium]|nr:hypothetical protein [Acetobacteraceae bacterium]
GGQGPRRPPTAAVGGGAGGGGAVAPPPPAMTVSTGRASIEAVISQRPLRMLEGSKTWMAGVRPP